MFYLEKIKDLQKSCKYSFFPKLVKDKLLIKSPILSKFFCVEFPRQKYTLPHSHNRILKIRKLRLIITVTWSADQIQVSSVIPRISFKVKPSSSESPTAFSGQETQLFFQIITVFINIQNIPSGFFLLQHHLTWGEMS